jgi:hypothetical protein
MTFFLMLLATAAILSALTVRATIHDSRGTRRPPRSHFDDPQFRSPTALG